MAKNRTGLPTLMLLLALASCRTPSPADTDVAHRVFFVDVLHPGHQFNGGGMPTMQFGDGQFTLTDNCLSFGGTYTINADDRTIVVADVHREIEPTCDPGIVARSDAVVKVLSVPANYDYCDSGTMRYESTNGTVGASGPC